MRLRINDDLEEYLDDDQVSKNIEIKSKIERQLNKRIKNLPRNQSVRNGWLTNKNLTSCTKQQLIQDYHP